MTMVRLKRYSWFFAYVCAIVSGVMVAIIPRSGAAATYSERTLYSFCSQANCTDGGGLANSGFSGPLSGLIMDPAGNLYGTNPNGGANNAGVAFELSPRPSGGWTYTMLHAFCSQTGCADGRVPLAGLIMDGAGNLYGTTFYGGAEPLSCPDQGTVSSCPPPAKPGGAWTESVLYAFKGGSDGAAPPAGVIMDGSGNLYGTSSGEGSASASTVFELTPPSTAGGAWTETVLYRFTGSNGADASAGLIFDASGALYGTAYGGGRVNGVVFRLTPNPNGSWSETVLYDFCSQTDCADGGGPQAGLIIDASGNLYGTTSLEGNPGHTTIFELSGAGVPLSENPQTSDFNADGKSDILWQSTDGQAAIWLMDGTKPTATALVGANPGTSWHVVASGDFHGSLYSDILWQNTDGAVSIWEMSGLKVVASASPGNPGPSWHAVGTGDFNGDGKSDILWQNTNGAVAIWEMNGLKAIGSAVVGNPGTSWHVIGSGDFNGDGFSDILWQNTNGAVAIWEMNGLKVIASAVVGNPGASWHVVGSGDFYGNGYSDILWQNTNGAVAIWEMDGLKVIGSAVIGNPGTSWHVVGSGDFYGNGFSDILWQNANGEVDIWEMDGAKVIDTGSPGNPGASWLTIGECPATRLAPCTR